MRKRESLRWEGARELESNMLHKHDTVDSRRDKKKRDREKEEENGDHRNNIGKDQKIAEVPKKKKLAHREL